MLHHWLLGFMVAGLPLLQTAAPVWQLTGVEPLRDQIGEVAGRPAYLTSVLLSPDGTAAAWQQDEETCVYTFADDSTACFPWPEGSQLFTDRYNQPGWSPDSRTLAYAEPYFTLGYDSDLWTLDTQTGEFSNHTDDGYAGNARLSREGQQMPVDYAPIWNPTTGELFFFHSEKRDPLFVNSNYSLQLRKLAADGQSELVRDLTLVMPGPLPLYSPPVFNADGTQLAFLALPYAWQETPGSGVWVLDLAGGTTEIRVPAAALVSALPAWARGEMAPQRLEWAGDNLVIWMEAASLDSPLFRTPLFYDTATGQVTSLIDYGPFADAAAYQAARAENPRAYYNNPQTGILLPGAAHYWMLAGAPIGEGMSLYELPLPGVGGEPRLLAEVDQQFGPGQDARPSLGADGKLVMLHTLFTVEPASS